jgi:hydrogenase-4 component F
MIWAILLVPALAGGLCMLVRSSRARRALLAVAAGAHCAMVAACWITRPQLVPGEWIGLDAAGLLFLSITSALFFCVAVYTCGYLGHEAGARTTDEEEGFLFTNSPEAVFTGCLLFFLSTMSLVAASRHFGLMWVAVEATTLASAPLIYFHRHHRSLEATWKYLLICSVGIALAMLGNFFLAVASSAASGEGAHLTLDSLLANAGRLDPVWLRAAFVLCLVGYGTKMGLAPMHTWLPDAHSEAPSVVSALLSGALLNCAFLSLLRVHSVLSAAGQGQLSRSLLILLGLLSMGLAAAFLIRQVDYKRMLAYSSVEHMGILALGAGLGGMAGFGSLMHAINHSLTKGMLFLAAGNLLAAYRTKLAGNIRGILRLNPLTGAIWLAGFLAITGSPPFGTFLSEIMVLRGAMAEGRYVLAAIYLATLGIAFVAMARVVLPMAYPDNNSSSNSITQPEGTRFEPLWAIAPPLVLGLTVLALGLCVPAWLAEMLQQAAVELGVR